jgi:hypothetical protein
MTWAPMDEGRRALWRFIRDAGEEGAKWELCAAFAGVPLDSPQLRATLLRLHQGGYIRPVAKRKAVGWLAGPKAPSGESLTPGDPAGALPTPGRPKLIDLAQADLRDQLGAVPNSIFHMAQLIGAAA